MTRRTVHPTITFAVRAGSSVQVSALVPGVVEDGGTCTATVSAGGHSATGSSSAGADATSTTCGSLTVPVGALPAGAATVTVSYRSAQSAGTSAAAAVHAS